MPSDEQTLAGVTCPECGAPAGCYHFNVLDRTTDEDRELGLRRYALRCEQCGFATAFVGERTRDAEECESEGSQK